MIGALREWLTSVMVVVMLLSVAQTLVPEGTIRKIGSFTGGLILLVTLLQPLLGADLKQLERNMETYQKEIEERQKELQQAGTSELAHIIERQTEAYISDKADALGVPVRVRVRAETGEDGIPIPVSAELEGAYSGTLAAYMERELGIPGERQVWHEN